MINDKNKLMKEVDIGIKLKKQLPQLIEELSRDGYNDGDIADAYAETVRVNFAPARLYLMWIGSGVVLMRVFAWLEGKYHWHECSLMDAALVFGSVYYSLVGYLLVMAATEGRITPLGLFMYWVSSGNIDPSKDLGPKERNRYEVGKILICCSVLCLALWVVWGKWLTRR
jgi:hypothetical protein